MIFISLVINSNLAVYTGWPKKLDLFERW